MSGYHNLARVSHMQQRRGRCCGETNKIDLGIQSSGGDLSSPGQIRRAAPAISQGAGQGALATGTWGEIERLGILADLFDALIQDGLRLLVGQVVAKIVVKWSWAGLLQSFSEAFHALVTSSLSFRFR